MYKFIATGLVTLDALLFLAMPLQAQEIKEKRDCTATISTAQRIIETGRSIRVTIRSSDISDIYPDHPANRPYRYSFALEGAASSSIMNSPNFMHIIATNIINSCKSVSLVSFGVNGTDWTISIGLMPEEKVAFFECIEPGISVRKSTWGQKTCL